MSRVHLLTLWLKLLLCEYSRVHLLTLWLKLCLCEYSRVHLLTGVYHLHIIPRLSSPHPHLSQYLSFDLPKLQIIWSEQRQMSFSYRKLSVYCRSHPVHPISWLPPILGWGPTPAVCSDQSRSVWLPHSWVGHCHTWGHHLSSLSLFTVVQCLFNSTLSFHFTY